MNIKKSAWTAFKYLIFIGLILNTCYLYIESRVTTESYNNVVNKKIELSENYNKLVEEYNKVRDEKIDLMVQIASLKTSNTIDSEKLNLALIALKQEREKTTWQHVKNDFDNMKDSSAKIIKEAYSNSISSINWLYNKFNN